MKYDYKNLIIVFTLVLLLVPLALQAQVTEGTLRGYVVDDTGEPLPGVTIEITSPSLMSARSQITDANGYFRFMFLPGGTYIICAKLDAFDVCWLKGIPITAAQTYTANVVMKQGVEEVTVEVTALAPVIDTESAAKTYNVTLSMMETIPLAARMNFSDVWMSLPGVADMYGDSPVINAGNITRDVEPGRSYFWSQHNQDDSYENKIMIDGMEVNDSMSGNSHAQINYEAIQEIDVKTAGAGAEYGNARSAFMNIITKSGGNDFQASFLFQYQPESLVGTNIEGGSPSATSYAIPAITLSGPIFKDKLWFLVSYKYDNENYTFPDTQIEPTIVRETRSHMPFAKLTWQAGNAHTMSFVYQDDYSVINNNNFPSYRYSTLDSAQVAKRGGPMTRLTWRWLASDSTYINFVAGYNHKPRDTYALTEDPRHQYTDRFQGGTTRYYDTGYGEDYWSVRENLLFSGHVTVFKENLFNTGAHEIKLGVDLRPYQHITRTRKYWGDEFGFFQYRLGLDYANYGLTQPYYYRGYKRRGAPGTPQDRYDNEVTVSNENFFVQDHWVLNKNLTLHLGLRFEHQREYMFYREEIPAWMTAIYSGMNENVEFDDSGFAPRLGLTWNLENVGVFKLHFGRYFEYVGTGDYNNYARTITSDEYRMSSANIGQGPGAMTLYRSGTLGYAPNYNKDMKMEWNDELVVSYEKELFLSMAFEASLVYRKINTSYQEDINAIFANGQFVDRLFPDFNTIWQRTFYKGDDRRTDFSYTGLQFNLKRNFTGVWGFMANYSLHYASYQKLAFDPTDPEQFVYASPRDLDMDRYGVRWSFHLSTFYRLPWNFMVALFVQGQSGIFLSDRTGDYERTQSAPNVTLSNGRRVADIGWAAFNNYYVGKKWGTQGRYTDDIWSVNLRLSKAFQIGQVRLEGYMDIYNLFNWASYASYSSVDIRHDFYADKTKPQSPRSAQVTLKIGFN